MFSCSYLGPRLLRVVRPRRGLRPRHDTGDIRIFARTQVRRGSLLLLHILAARGLLLLFFLTGALSGTLVLSGSKLGHVTSVGSRTAEPEFRLGDPS